MPRRKILVTGATGLLGAAAVPFLRERGHEVVTQGRRGKADVICDLTQASSLDAVRAHRPEVILHLAALTDVDACEREPKTAFAVHVRVTERLAKLVRETGASLIQISTDQVYDGPGPHSESAVRPRNVYAWTKVAAEWLTLNAGGTVLRTNFFGRSDVAGRASLSDWLVGSLRQKRAITLFTDIYFSPLSLRTLVGELARVAEAPMPGVFNLGSREGLSKHAFALALADRLGLRHDTATAGTSGGGSLLAYRPKDMRMNVGHYEKHFGIALPRLRDEITLCGRDYENQH